MGIQHGSALSVHFQHGRYRRSPTVYSVYVDGELMRYRGMVAVNMEARDAEARIAASSVAITVRVVEQLRRYFGREPKDVHVYMDGAVRVANKTTDRPIFRFNAKLIRSLYVDGCRRHGMRVHHLDVGEAELQMYLKRDREVDLNVFVSDDSDLLSIAYAHRPRQVHDVGPLRSLDNHVVVRDDASSQQQQQSSSCLVSSGNVTTTAAAVNGGGAAVNDANVRYDSAIETRIRDSCVWVRNGTASSAMARPLAGGGGCAGSPNVSSTLIFHGMDACREVMHLGVTQFRVFCALCGTDFTPSMFTQTAIKAIASASREDKLFLDRLQEPLEIAAGLLLLAVYHGATLKRMENKTKHAPSCGDPLVALAAALRMYCSYIETGVMDERTIPKPPMYAAQHTLLRIMKGDSDHAKRQLKSWCVKLWATAPHGPLEAVAKVREHRRRDREAAAAVIDSVGARSDGRPAETDHNATTNESSSSPGTAAEQPNSEALQMEPGALLKGILQAAERRSRGPMLFRLGDRGVGGRRITKKTMATAKERQQARMVRMTIDR